MAYFDKQQGIVGRSQNRDHMPNWRRWQDETIERLQKNKGAKKKRGKRDRS